MSFDYDRESYNKLEIWLINDRTIQGGIYAIIMDGIIVYIGKTGCLAHRLAQHLSAISGNYTSNKSGLNMYDCLKYWSDQGHLIDFKMTTSDELRDEKCRSRIKKKYLSAYDEDPLGIAESLMIMKHKPVLNTRVPISFRLNMNRFYDKDLNLKQQLMSSDIDWIREAANIEPKFI